MMSTSLTSPLWYGIVSVPHSHMYSLQRITLQSWSKLNKSGGGPWPEERSSPAACFLNYGEQFPQLLVTGGLDIWGRPLGDVWTLDVERGKWRKVSISVMILE